MVHILGRLGRAWILAFGQRLNARPIGQQPCLEFMLRGVGMETRLRTDPGRHFRTRVGGVVEIGRIGAGIHIGQRDHGVIGSQQKPHFPLQLLPLGDSSVLGQEIELRHLAGKTRLQPRDQGLLERGFRGALDQDGDADRHARPPRRPMLQS